MLIFFLDEKFLFIYLEDKNNHKYGEKKLDERGRSIYHLIEMYL
jgi:hypothetical protein